MQARAVRWGGTNPDASSDGKPVSLLKVAVATQPPLFREILARRLARERALQVVGLAGSPEEIHEVLRRKTPMVLIFDYDGIGPDAEGMIRRMRRAAPATRILVLAMGSDAETVGRALSAGASGLVGKQQKFATLARAVDAVAAGELWADRSVVAQMLESVTSRARVLGQNGELTKREQEVTDLVGRGLGNSAIARSLNIRELTVKRHLNRIFRKLQVDSRAAAGLRALVRPN